MTQTFTFSLAMAALLCFGAVADSQAQYVFADAPTTASAGLGAYRQNFDGLAGANAYFQSNSTLPGVYARYTLNVVGGEYESYQRGWGNPARLSPNNGSEGATSQSSVENNGTAHGPAWYHFGTTGSADRALGGIAGTATWDGQGYVGIRLKNGSTKVITNLEVEYAMEQWYNSSRTQAATVTVEYQRSTGAIASVFDGRWTAISALNVAAPSTSAAIAPRNGNAATNRRVMRATLSGLNLRVGEEIMLRFGYAFNSASNGNGLSIDDVVITPQTNIYYSADDDSKKLDSKSSWGTNTDGTGTAPATFAAGDLVVYLNAAAPTRYLMETLEPQATDSFFAWGFFDSVLQQKEHFSDYVFEDVAADLLRRDPALRARLEQLKAADAAFAANGPAQLEWVYQNSTYHEAGHNRYPVARWLGTGRVSE